MVHTELALGLVGLALTSQSVGGRLRRQVHLVAVDSASAVHDELLLLLLLLLEIRVLAVQVGVHLTLLLEIRVLVV